MLYIIKILKLIYFFRHIPNSLAAEFNLYNMRNLYGAVKDKITYYGHHH